MDAKPTTDTPAAEEKATPPKMGIQYMPCWDRRNQALALYRPVCTLTYADGRRVSGDMATKAYKTDAQKLKLDLWVIQHGVKALFPMVNAHHITPMWLPIHANSLRGPALQKLCTTLSAYTQRIRDDYLVIEIEDDGAWTDLALQEAMTALRAQNVQIAFHLKTPTVSVTLPPAVWLGSTQLHDSSMLETLQAHTGQTYLQNIPDRTSLQQALSASVTCLGGPALVKNAPKLRPPFPLPIERLQK